MMKIHRQIGGVFLLFITWGEKTIFIPIVRY